MIDASAIVAILLRRPGSEALLARLDAAPPPYLATPVALLEAVAALAAAKAGRTAVTPALLAKAREAVSEFAAALALREVPVTAELGRRAGDLLVTDGVPPGRALGLAAARSYRTDFLSADEPSMRIAVR